MHRIDAISCGSSFDTNLMFSIRPGFKSTFSMMVKMVLACTGLITGCGSADRPSYAEEEWQDDVRPVSESWNVHYAITESHSRDGGSLPRLFMNAGHMASYKDDSTYTVLTPGEDGRDATVRAVIFNVETGDTSAVVRAQRIVYLDADRRFEASGDVVVDGTENRRMWSERLLWNEETQRISAPGYVRIVTPSERIEGYNLDADEDLDNYTLERVTGEAEIDDSDDPETAASEQSAEDGEQ